MVSSPQYEQFVLFGDSITEQASVQDRGFALQPTLQNAYIRRLDVVNRGFSGYNTEHARRVLAHALPDPAQARVRLLLVFFGANDACLASAPSGQFVPLATYRANLTAILTHPAVRAHTPRIVLVTPPPLEERKQLACAPPPADGDDAAARTRKNTVTVEYVQAALEVGATLGVPVLDLFRAFLRRAGWCEGQPFPGSLDQPENEVMKELLIDGLHFDGAGYKVMYEELMSLIAETWPDETPESIPYVWPRWDNDDYWKSKGVIRDGSSHVT